MKATTNPAAWWAPALAAFGLLVSLWAIPVASGGASSTGTTWASLGTVFPSAEQASQYGSAVDASTTSSVYAWCGANGIYVAKT